MNALPGRGSVNLGRNANRTCAEGRFQLVGLVFVTFLTLLRDLRLGVPWRNLFRKSELSSKSYKNPDLNQQIPVFKKIG